MDSRDPANRRSAHARYLNYREEKERKKKKKKKKGEEKNESSRNTNDALGVAVFFFLSRKGKFVDEERVIGYTRDPSTTRIFGLVTPVSRPVATNSFLPRENTIGSIKVATFR